ncbi:MAG TPA: sulfotransferase [Pirellulales bacterium]|nr:sulfotransferase [Pirellulales bacterium]
MPTEFNTLVARAQEEHRAGRLTEVVETYRRMLALRPGVAEIHNNLASALVALGRTDEAVAEFERATALKPTLLEAQIGLGDLLHEQGKLADAIVRYRQAIALRPDLAETHNNLGAALASLGHVEEGLAHCQRALVMRPGLFPAHHNLGNIYRRKGRLAQAAEHYRQAIAMQPDYAEAHHNLANVLKEQGRFDEAQASYERALALRPDYTEALYHLTDLKKYQAGSAELAALEALAETPENIPPAKRLYLHFALGKALEDAGDYDRAFAHLAAGNALRRGQIKYNETAYLGYLRRIADAFDPALFARFATAGDPAPTPIFIVGMPRSGSTLVEQILASHAQVQAGGELTLLDDVVHSIADKAGRHVSFPACAAAIETDGWRQLGAAYLKGLPPLEAGKTRITDKMPKNFVYAGLIRLILPGARIIHTVRDPVDTCVSCFSRLFMSGLAYSHDLGELGRYYRGYHALMEHWRAVLPAGTMLEVRYENVVHDLAGQARRMIDFLGLAWDDRCLAFHETERSIATPSSVQARQPLYRDSVERWRRYEAHLGPLLAELAPLR